MGLKVEPLENKNLSRRNGLSNPRDIKQGKTKFEKIRTQFSTFLNLKTWGYLFYLSGTMGGIFDDFSLLYFYCYSSAQIMACFFSYFAFRRFLVSFDLSFLRNEFSKI